MVEGGADDQDVSFVLVHRPRSCLRLRLWVRAPLSVLCLALLVWCLNFMIWFIKDWNDTETINIVKSAHGDDDDDW